MIQHLNYLKGLSLELECGDFISAKEFYLKSLTETDSVNHWVRREVISRLIRINYRMGFPKNSPEIALISRYFIK